MYKYEDFKPFMGDPSSIDQMLRVIIKIKELPFMFKMVDAIPCGDSWLSMACIDMLVEIKAIKLVKDHETSNFKVYKKVSDIFF